MFDEMGIGGEKKKKETQMWKTVDYRVVQY
jgi:hypothetical protein